MRGFVLLVLFAFIIRGCGGPIIPDEGDNKDTLRDKPSNSDTDSNSGTRKIVISPHQEGSNNKQTTEINPFYLTKNLTVNHYKIYQYNFDIHFHFGDSAINITEIISGIVNGNLFIPKKIESLDGRFSFDSNAFINKDSIISQKDNYVITANKKTNGDYELAIFDTDTTVINPPPMEFKVTYAPVIENNYYKYIGTIINEQPNGQGTLIVKEDGYRPNNNSSITANKGDVFIGDFKEGNLIKYTQLDKNGDTLRLNHTPSEYDFVFPIDSTDLKNYPLKQRKHIDVGLGNLFAVSNKYCKQKKIIPQDVNIGADMTKEARDEFLAMFNSKSKFEYNPKKVGESAYRIQKDINGFFITAIVKTKQGLDTIKRRRNELKIRFNEKWQISGFDCKLLPDNIQFCDNVDKETQKYITHWLWEFRVAYGKNVDSVLLFFDNNAKILTGNIHEDRTDSTLHNRDSYGDKLRVIYQNEKRPPKLTFTDAYVCRCTDKNWLNWYDIRLYQDWHNRLYSDDGCLSMRWKIDNLADKPIIFVRCWKEDEDVDLSAYWPVKF